MKVRKVPDALVFGLVAAYNQQRLDAISTSAHLERSAVDSTDGDYMNPTVTRLSVSSANATNEDTLVTLANELKADINLHFADANAHNTAVSSAVATAAATNTATAVTLLNALKSAYGTHLSASNVHYTNDSTNTVSAANATDEATAITLANELKTDVNAHMASAPAGVYLDVVEA